MTEYITRDATDWITCVPSCGNEPHMDGFYPCAADGTEIEPVGGPGGWGSDGRYRLVCAKCGRIIDQDTLEVLGFRERDSIDVLYRILGDQLG